MKISDWILTYISNINLRVCDYKWNFAPHKARCVICGKVIKSMDLDYSPKSCGWCRIRSYYGKHFICHKCLAHRNYKPYVKQVDEDEENLWRKKRRRIT